MKKEKTPMELAKASARRRKFVVHLFVEMEIAQSLFDDVLTDEWRKQFYDFHSPDDVAGNLALCLVQGMPMSSLDGYADQGDNARIGPLDIDYVEEEIEPAKPKPTTRPRMKKRVANDQRSKSR